MKTGNRYLIQSSFGSIFEVKCIEVTETAFKIFNIVQKSEQWLKKNDFGPYGSYSVYADLGLTAPESSSSAPLRKLNYQAKLGAIWGILTKKQKEIVQEIYQRIDKELPAPLESQELRRFGEEKLIT